MKNVNDVKVNDIIDEYCIEKYGHRDWSYLYSDDKKLNKATKERLKLGEHTIEDGVVIWHDAEQLFQDIKDGKFGVRH